MEPANGETTNDELRGYRVNGPDLHRYRLLYQPLEAASRTLIGRKC